MPTLSEIMQAVKGALPDLSSLTGSKPQSPLLEDKPGYDDYAESMMVKGKAPMSFADWVKAGKPAAG
jgi:hypothetical protein